MNKAARTRALITCCALAACFTLFSFRLVHLQVTMREVERGRAAQKHVNKQIITARRGMIQDVRGEALAQNEPVHTVIADGTLIKDRAAVAALLAGPLKMNEAQLLEKLSREVFSQSQKKKAPSPYIVLKKEVSETVTEALQAQMDRRNMRGIFFEEASTRVYPNRQMLCHVLGSVNGEEVGVEGVERNMDAYLRGHDGFRYTERDRQGREIVPYRGQEHGARNGCNVRLTIDMGLQCIVETELDAAMKQFRPKSATVIMMNPKTGEILALANRPNFNPNTEEEVPAENRRNRAITDTYEPGSTFKIVPTAAALSEKLVQPDTMIFCENGYFAPYKLHDHHPYASLSVNDGLVKSSNIMMAKLAIQVGDQKFYEYVRRFGFGERTGVNLPGEVGGKVHLPHGWTKLSITRIPMGHEVAVTALQTTAAMCAIANGGHLMMPQIIREIVDDSGKIISQFPPQQVRRVASKDAADAVRSALREVASKKGTAALASVKGFNVGGKTGTAQKTDKDGRYTHDKHVVSFVGFMPAEDPAFVALVMLDEARAPHNLNVGGLVAAPIFSRIAEKSARYLGLVPEPEAPEGPMVAAQLETLRRR